MRFFYLAQNFTSSGREDIDVQMLGSGRPFTIQLLEPERVLSPDVLSDIERKINQMDPLLVRVSDLTLISRSVCHLSLCQSVKYYDSVTYQTECPSLLSAFRI